MDTSLNNLLFVESSSIIKKNVTTSLQSLGVNIEFASTGSEALELIDKKKYNLISLSTKLDDMDGFELCEKIVDYRIPLIFLTANDTIEDRIKGFKLGVNNFILKSDIRIGLTKAVEEILYPSLKFGNFKVLLVDDSNIVIKAMEQTLDALGVEILTANNGEEALKFFENHNIDLVITDLHMPIMNGEELCARIRYELKNKTLPIIFLSSDGDQEKRLKMFRAGASDYLLKPFTVEELRARVTVYLERIIRERKIKSLTNTLIEKNKALNNFAYRAAHDLKAPVRHISFFSKQIEKKLTEKDKDILSSVSRVNIATNTMSKLINTLLQYAKSSSVSLIQEKTNLNKVVNIAADILEKDLEEANADLNVEELEIVNVDSNLMTHVFQNLISNSIKYKAEDRNVCINISCIKKDDNFVEVIVKDNGRGFDNKIAERIFNEFERGVTESEVVGTGLGLSLCREVINKHGGSIKAKGEVGKGATFSIKLPI